MLTRPQPHEAEAEATTHEAEAEAEARFFGLEAEARPRGLTSLIDYLVFPEVATIFLALIDLKLATPRPSCQPD